MKTQLNHMRRLKEDAAMVVNDICDQDTGWFYALQRSIQTGGRAIDEVEKILTDIVAILDALETGKGTFSSQGQAMDGYAALAAFKSAAMKARDLV